MSKISKLVIIKSLEAVRKNNPLVLNITNFVVMNSTANALLSIGASPIMAHAVSEIKEMLSISNSLVINIGTIDEVWFKSMKLAVTIAKQMKKPVVLDPVGAGATKFRTQKSLELLKSGKISVIRGNLGEISALLGNHGLTKGVDVAKYSDTVAEKSALLCAKKFKTVVAVTGPIDYVSDGRVVYQLKNGVSLLEKVTGTGCMVSALTGAFLAVTNPMTAAISAITVLNIAAEKACTEAKTSGSFQVKLFDWLFKISQKEISQKTKIFDKAIQ